MQTGLPSFSDYSEHIRLSLNADREGGFLSVGCLPAQYRLALYTCVSVCRSLAGTSQPNLVQLTSWPFTKERAAGHAQATDLGLIF